MRAINMERVRCSVFGVRGAREKRGQIWVETIIYTLIGLTIIGLVLAGALPKINAKKDEVAIEQSIDAMGKINNKIYEAQRALGNRRVVNLDIRKGALIIDMDEDTISWIIDSSFLYSELDVPISLGHLTVTTKERGSRSWEVELEMGYAADLRYNEQTSGVKQLDVAPTPYRLAIENIGREGGDIVIKLSEAS